MGHAPFDGDAQVGHVAEFHGVVGLGEDGLGEVGADLVDVDVEGGDDVDVGDGVVAERGVHDAGDIVAGLGVLVEVQPLHERRRAVPHPDDRYVDLAHVAGTSFTACWGSEWCAAWAAKPARPTQRTGVGE